MTGDPDMLCGCLTHERLAGDLRGGTSSKQRHEGWERQVIPKPPLGDCFVQLQASRETVGWSGWRVRIASTSAWLCCTLFAQREMKLHVLAVCSLPKH